MFRYFYLLVLSKRNFVASTQDLTGTWTKETISIPDINNKLEINSFTLALPMRLSTLERIGANIQFSKMIRCGSI